MKEIMFDEMLRLFLLSQSNPHYKLAVVDTQHAIGFQEEADYMLIVSLEGEEFETTNKEG